MISEIMAESIWKSGRIRMRGNILNRNEEAGVRATGEAL